jgi:hypothetical protein
MLLARYDKSMSFSIVCANPWYLDCGGVTGVRNPDSLDLECARNHHAGAWDCPGRATVSILHKAVATNELSCLSNCAHFHIADLSTIIICSGRS